MSDFSKACNETSDAYSRMCSMYSKIALSDDVPSPLLDAVGDYILARERETAIIISEVMKENA